MSIGTTVLRAVSAAGFALAITAVPAMADAGKAPTFQDVLAAPDDVSLNLAYARSEAQSGRLSSAAAALERILLIAPGENGVRLFYVAVLYRLGDLQGAQQQLGALDESTLTPVQKAEAGKYAGLIAAGRRSVRFSGNIAAGFAYDTNALGALSTELEYFGPLPKKSGESAVVSGAFNLTDDLTQDGDLAYFASLGAYSRSSVAGPDADFLSFNLFTGIKGSELTSDWEIGAVVNRYEVFDAPYLGEYGGRAQYNWHANTALTWTGTFEAVAQDYHEPLIAALVPVFIPGTHNGARFDLSGGASYRIDAAQAFSADLGIEDKTAGYEPFAYVAPFVDLGYHALLGGGVYFDAQGDYRFVDYQKFDPVFTHILREDSRGTGRLALGAPLSAFSSAGATGDYREDLILEGAVTYTDRTSRYPVAAYHDVGVEARIIWKFGDGETR